MFAQLTRFETGKTMLVNLDHLVWVGRHAAGAVITLTSQGFDQDNEIVSEYFKVAETLEQIAGLVSPLRVED